MRSRGSVISRFTGIGAAAALLALILWPFAARWDQVDWPYLILLAIAALCGLVILLLTGLDLLLRPRRGPEVNPIRVFDILSGAALLGFALLQLGWLSAWLYP
jgi:hypothetical protein